MSALFHLSFYVNDLPASRQFYAETLGCAEGRSCAEWIDFNFFGHQLSLHLSNAVAQNQTALVDVHQVPMPHFGVILPLQDWQQLIARLQAKGVVFTVPPTWRFVGQPGQQATAFVCDPSGNAIEFKGFADLNYVYQG